MNDVERRVMSQHIGAAVLAVQEKFRDRGPEEVIPEIIATLLSLAAFVSYKHAGLSRQHFMHACEVAAEEEFK